MDAKTAVEILGNRSGDCVMLATYEATEISALVDRQVGKIDQQAKRIAELEREAELGRLAVKGFKEESPDWKCGGVLHSQKCEETVDSFTRCDWQLFCQLRAELLAEEGNKDA